MNHIHLLVTPLSELTEAEFTYLLAHKAEIKSLAGTPAHYKAIGERAQVEHAKRVEAKRLAKERTKELRRRAKDEAACQQYLRTFLA